MRIVLKYIPIIFIIILLLLSTLLINGTSSTLNNSYTLNIRWDYLVHALVYIPLIPLLSFNREKLRTKNIIILSLILAISLEAIQYLIPWRTSNVNDVFSNVLGVGIGFVLMKVVSKQS